MSDPVLEAAFASTAVAKIPGRSYAPKIPVGTHTVILKQFRVKNTRGKGRMFDAEFVVLDGGTADGETRGWPWFTGADVNGMQDGFLRGFLETVAKSIGDKESTIPQLGAMLAGSAQLGRGMQLKVVVRNQVDKYGNVKMNPKENAPYTEAIWYPITQSPEQIVEGRKALDADPQHALRAEAPEQQQQMVAPPAYVAPVQPVAAPVAAPAPVAAAPAGLSLLAALGKK